jgi:hypothetical protein
MELSNSGFRPTKGGSAAMSARGPTLCVSAWNNGSSLFGGLASSAFRAFDLSAADILREPALLFGIGSVPSWDQKNEAVQSDSRPDRQGDWHESPKRTHFIHRPAKDIHRQTEFCRFRSRSGDRGSRSSEQGRYDRRYDDRGRRADAGQSPRPSLLPEVPWPSRPMPASSSSRMRRSSL